MHSILLQIKLDENCKEISSVIEESGLLVVTAPKGIGNEKLNEFLLGFTSEELRKIKHIQDKNKEIFRKKSHNMIKKSEEELKLPFGVSLQIRTQTKKLFDCRTEIYGITFGGIMLLAAPLQYMQDSIVERIVRYSVYLMACNYQKQWSRINTINTSIGIYPDFTPEKVESITVSDEDRYKIPVSEKTIKEIKSDYEKAVKELIDEMDKKPISYF